MLLSKITTGSVIQEFDTETNQWISQRFVAGDQVAYGEECNSVECSFAMFEQICNSYLPFDMVQPEKLVGVRDTGVKAACVLCGCDVELGRGLCDDCMSESVSKLVPFLT